MPFGCNHCASADLTANTEDMVKSTSGARRWRFDRRALVLGFQAVRTFQEFLPPWAIRKESLDGLGSPLEVRLQLSRQAPERRHCDFVDRSANQPGHAQDGGSFG